MASTAGVNFARFMELRGYQVLEKYGVLWHQAPCGMYMSLPYRLPVELDPGDASEMVRSMASIGVRYPSRHWSGLTSGLYVCRNRDYRFESLHRNFRARVRQGLPFCEV